MIDQLCLDRVCLDQVSVAETRDTAVVALSRYQKWCLVVLVSAVIAGLLTFRLAFLTILLASITTIYSAIVLLKILLAATSASVPEHEPYSPLPDSVLPRVTILAPLYDEGAVVCQLVNRLDQLEWPRKRLEVLLLIRDSDQATRQALHGFHLPRGFRVFDIEPEYYGTKPAALNAALQIAEGEYFVIYDAESIPDPKQLRDLYSGLRAAPPGTVAASGVPVVSNWRGGRSSFMSRMLAAEYAAHYQLHNPSLIARGWPAPLPGNSVMFQMDAIKQVGLYDRYNKTEDADIAVRIARRGWRTTCAMTESLEQAPISYGAWRRQRRRWIDGFMQTYLVHMRHPLRLYRDLGAVRFGVFQLVVGGGPLVLLINPILVTMTLAYALTGASVIRDLQPPFTYYQAMICFVFGNSFFVFLLMMGSMKKKMWDVVPWILLSPIYWLAMSHASLNALYDLFFQPGRWYKTAHDDDSDEEGRAWRELSIDIGVAAAVTSGVVPATAALDSP